MLIQSLSGVAVTPSVPVSNNGPVVVAQPSVEAATPQPVSTAQLATEVSKINRSLQQLNRNVEMSLSVDQDSHQTVVRLTDKETGETLMQYPSEAVLAISRDIDAFQQATLLKREA